MKNTGLTFRISQGCKGVLPLNWTRIWVSDDQERIPGSRSQVNQVDNSLFWNDVVRQQDPVVRRTQQIRVRVLDLILNDKVLDEAAVESPRTQVNTGCRWIGGDEVVGRSRSLRSWSWSQKQPTKGIIIIIHDQAMKPKTRERRERSCFSIKIHTPRRVSNVGSSNRESELILLWSYESGHKFRLLCYFRWNDRKERREKVTQEEQCLE